MKKQICCIIAAVTVVTMLPGCGRKRYTCRLFACTGSCEHGHAGECCPTDERRCAGADNNGRYGL